MCIHLKILKQRALLESVNQDFVGCLVCFVPHELDFFFVNSLSGAANLAKLGMKSE